MYSVDGAAAPGASKKWTFDIVHDIESAPRRSRSEEQGDIPFRSNPGYLVDNRAIEFAMKRPLMMWTGETLQNASDKRNKDVVIHSSLMSGIYNSNNNLSALTVQIIETL
jgi:hypothetical protein